MFAQTEFYDGNFVSLTVVHALSKPCESLFDSIRGGWDVEQTIAEVAVPRRTLEKQPQKTQPSSDACI